MCALLSLSSAPLTLSPAGFKLGLCGARPLNQPYSILSLSNNTSIVTTLDKAYSNFMQLYRVRAHMHHYTDYMDASIFNDALTSTMDVISAYNESEYGREEGREGRVLDASCCALLHMGSGEEE